MDSVIQKIINAITPASTQTYTKKSVPFTPNPGTPAFAKTVQPAAPNLPRPVPEQWKPAIQAMYSHYPSLPKGVLEATLMQESGMGTNSAAYHPSNGESAWIAGVTPAAKTHLAQRGISPDLNTQAGAIQGMAHYMAARQSGVDDKGKSFTYNDPSKLYFDRYKTNSTSSLPATGTARSNFKTYVDYYAGNNFNSLTKSK